MNTKIFLHCFVLMTAIALTTFLGEYIIRPLLHLPVVKAHAFFPVSSFPTILKHLSGKDEQSAEKPKVRMIRLELKSGKSVEGLFVSEEDGWVEIKNNDGDPISFHVSEIKNSEVLSSSDQ